MLAEVAHMGKINCSLGSGKNMAFINTFYAILNLFLITSQIIEMTGNSACSDPLTFSTFRDVTALF